MKFLDPNLFYPHFSKKFNYDLWEKKLQNVEMKYEEYSNNCKKDIDKELLKIYETTEHFHDYNFHKIIFHANKTFSCRDKVDIIEMRLFSKDEEEISLFLKDIIGFSMDMNQLNFKEQERVGLEDIVLCEIGYEFNCSFINLFLISGTEISINFKTANYKIEKYKK